MVGRGKRYAQGGRIRWGEGGRGQRESKRERVRTRERTREREREPTIRPNLFLRLVQYINPVKWLGFKKEKGNGARSGD